MSEVGTTTVLDFLTKKDVEDVYPERRRADSVARMIWRLANGKSGGRRWEPIRLLTTAAAATGSRAGRVLPARRPPGASGPGLAPATS